MRKIIVIGLPKTGTTSLHHAAEMLGLKSAHMLNDADTIEQVRRGDYRLKVLQACDMVSDVPVPTIFPQLDTAFPGARFILTRRPVEPWIASQRKAPFSHNTPKPGSTRDFYRAMLYGVTDFSEERLRWVYDDHHRRVAHHFAGREADLLEMDITAGDGWEALCPFLGLPVPDAPFPKANAAAEKQGAAERPGWRRRLKRRLIG